MCIHIYIYVYIYIYIHTCLSECIRVRANAHVQVNEDVCVLMYVHTYSPAESGSWVVLSGVLNLPIWVIAIDALLLPTHLVPCWGHIKNDRF